MRGEIEMKKLRIVHDTLPMNPREWDNVGIIYTVNSRYIECEGEPPSENDIKLPVYIHSRGNIVISTRLFSCKWDSDQIGVVYATEQTVNNEYKGNVDQVIKILQSEIRELNDYAQGEVWGYEVVEDGDIIDSCYGFIGSELEETGLIENLSYDFTLERITEAWENRFEEVIFEQEKCSYCGKPL
jgi:hypothetical protein